MSTDTSNTGAFRLSLPADVLREAERVQSGRKDDMRVDGWKPSLIGRLIERLTGASAR